MRIRRRGKKCAVLVALAGTGILLAAGFLLRDPFWWWWRSRGMVEAWVDKDGWSFTLTSPEAVSNALRATRRLVERLADAGDKYDGVFRQTLLALETRVEFRRNHDQDTQADLGVYYFPMGERSGCLGGFNGRAYECPPAAWDEYLRTILEPAVPQLKARLRDPKQSNDARADAATALLFVQPEDPSILKVLIEELGDEILRYAAMAILRQLGGKAEPALPALKAMSEDPAMDDYDRNCALELIQSIRADLFLIEPDN